MPLSTSSTIERRVHRRLAPVGTWTSPPWLHRHPANPVLAAADVPYESELVFNCSVLREGGQYTTVFRNDFRPDRDTIGGFDTNFGRASSPDGVHWSVEPTPLLHVRTDYIKRLYDPRVTPLEGRYYLTACASTEDGPRAVCYGSDDLRTFDLIDMSLPCSRNTLLFPEKINGYYYRLERPMWSAIDSLYLKHAGAWIGQYFDIFISRSPDLVHWGGSQPLIRTAQIPYANIKIGPGAVPIRTAHGWLLLIHGVDFDPQRGKNGWEPAWKCRYHGGVALLDLDDPTRLLGYGRTPLITPEAPYETDGGYRNHVVFPMAGLVDEQGKIEIYYGAADTVICLATANIEQLIAMCKPV
jgi:beta-1,4-mannooligosaccharide/beta-1,4-mannosyl-N-acetylglucosamine phosphorylase